MVTRLRTLSSLFALGSLALWTGTAHAIVNVHRSVVTRVAPVYPELARRMHIGGRVVLLVSIDANGNVSSTKVESGHALLAPAAQDAVKRWHFAPNPEPSQSEIDVNFDLDGQ